MTERGTETVWHWLTPDGKEAQGAQADLAARLSSQTLPASTLVWKKTWADWMPANRVTVLASALPASARLPAREPMRDLTADKPPPAPRRAEMRTLSAVSNGAVKAFESPPPNAGPMRHPRPTATAEARAPIPTLADEELPNATDTLRPAGAMPPPPRGVPRPGAFVPVATAIPNTDAIATPIPGIRVATRPSNPLPMALAQTVEAPASPAPEAVRDSSQISGMQPRTSTPVPFDPPPHAPLPSSLGAAASSMLPGAPDVSLGLRVLLGFLSAVCVLLAVALVFALRALNAEPHAASATPAQATASAAVVELAPGCQLRAPAAKLASSVERSVEPRFLDLSDERVAVGFAATRSQASGVVVHLGALDANAVFDEARERPVLGVSPVTAEPLTFNADRDDGTLSMPHSLDVTPRTVLGYSSDGLAKSVDGQPPELVWALSHEVSTEPRVARAGGQGFAVALRHGGLGGAILSGWLGSDLKPRSELVPVAATAKLVGSPAVAARDDALLLAFAARDSETEAWRIRLGKAGASSPVTALSVHSTPTEGLGNGAIAPTLAALGSDRWVLQWTQGSAGQYRVYVQELGSDLRAIGAPVAASPKGASAGLGAVRVRDESALSVFVLTVGGRDELWGASVTCR